MRAPCRFGPMLTAALAVLLVSACDSQGGATSAPPKLIGVWEWAGTSGGVDGESRLPGPGDPRITLQFESDGRAIFRRDGNVAREQRYRVSNEVTILGPEELPVLYFDDEELGRVVWIDENGETLTLSDNVYDGFSLEYGRVRE